MKRQYTAAQLAQYTQLAIDAQKSNSMATHVLLRLARQPLHPHRVTALVDELNLVVRSMTSQIFLCEQVAHSGVHKRYDVIRVNLGTTCDYCLETGTTPQRQTNDHDLEELNASQAWRIQVETLFVLTLKVAHKVSENSFSPRRTVDDSLRSLAGLIKILSRQRRHLERISLPLPTEITVVDDCGPTCPDCGRPYELTATDE